MKPALVFFWGLFVVLQAFPDIGFERRKYLEQVGKVLDCNGKLDLLDIYEAKVQYRFTLDIPTQGTPRENAIQMISRLKDLHPRRFEFYMGLLKTIIPQKSTFVSGIDLHHKNALTALVPKACTQKTVLRIDLKGTRGTAVAGQADEFDFHFTYDQDLFLQLDKKNQTALILHSLIAFEGALGDFIEDPVPSRLYTGLLMSKNIQSMTAKQFMGFLSSIDFLSWLDW